MIRAAIKTRSLLVAGRRRALSSQSSAPAMPERLTTTRSPSELEQLGASIAKRRRPGDVIFLRGYKLPLLVPIGSSPREWVANALGMAATWGAARRASRAASCAPTSVTRRSR